MKKIAIIFISCLCLLTFIGCGDNSSSSTSSGTSLHSGQSMELKETIPVCKSKEDLDKFVSYDDHNDTIGTMEMKNSGAVQFLPKNTTFKIIKVGEAVDGGQNVQIQTSDNKKWFTIILEEHRYDLKKQ